ncbi:MAG: hypothetical protein IKK34_14480 [Clostridia bacterium]|nr:hypothetical protein [Clostridia bacterium]
MMAVEACDTREADLLRRIDRIYGDALRTAIKRQEAFFRKLNDVQTGKIKPPQSYVDTNRVDVWRRGFVSELIRQNNVINGIMDELDRAGVRAVAEIRAELPEYYTLNRDEARAILQSGMRTAGFDGTLTQMTRRQVETIISDTESPFSRLAYNNLGQNPVARRRLQNQLAQATILGEGQPEIIRRIRAVTGQTYAQAKRVAQTERTRVQSQARYDAGAEAMALGVAVINTWSTRMVNSRDSHIRLNGKTVLQGDYFPNSQLRYPGDPTAPAREVVNCHCVLVPDVLMDGQQVVDGMVI